MVAMRVGTRDLYMSCEVSLHSPKFTDSVDVNERGKRRRIKAKLTKSSIVLQDYVKTAHSNESRRRQEEESRSGGPIGASP
jgi:hypothetical protein